MTDDSDPDDEFLDIDDPRSGTDPSPPPAFDLASLQAKYDASTQGEWQATVEPPGCSVVAWVQSGNDDLLCACKDGTLEDCQFAASIHNAFPAMVAELAELRAERDRLRETLQRAIKWLRRIEAEYPGCLNDDAISRHLESALTPSEPKPEGGV